MAIVAVFNQKGGVGKTTTALNLLAAIASRKQRPLAIDLDPQCHLTHIFGVHPRTADDTIYSFFMRQRPLDDIAQITKSGVIMLPAHLELAKLDSVLGKGVNVVTRLRHGAARAERDAGTGGDRLLPAPERAVAQCDLRRATSLLVPVSADFLSLQGRRAGRARAQRAGARIQAAAAAALPADALRRAAAHDRTRCGRACARRCGATRSAGR